MHAIEGRYHALAKERIILLRCESLELPMSQLGDGVAKVADERIEALYWSTWHATPISFFSTLRLERDYIDAADRRLTPLTFTRRTQPACPVAGRWPAPVMSVRA